MPLRGLLTRDVIVATTNYSFLALVEIIFRALQPIFLSTPIVLGGLGLGPPMIGTILSIFGVLNGVFRLLFFSWMTDRFGVKWVYLMGIAASVPCFSLFPIINYLARNSVEGHGGLGAEVWVMVGLQVVMAVLVSSCFGTSHVEKTELPMDLCSLLVRFRRNIHLHRRRCTQQSLLGSHEWTRAAVGVYHACGRPRLSELDLFAVY